LLALSLTVLDPKRTFAAFETAELRLRGQASQSRQGRPSTANQDSAKPVDGDRWAVKKVIEIPAEPASEDRF
jgi:hypothetical protein